MTGGSRTGPALKLHIWSRSSSRLPIPRPPLALNAGWVFPLAAVGAGEPPGDLGVADHLAGRGVDRDRAPAELHRDIPEDAACRGDVALLDVGHRLGAVGTGGEEVAHVLARRGRGVGLEVRLVLFLGILLRLQQWPAGHRRLALAVGEELPPLGAGLQRALVAVDEQGPGVIRVGRGAPGAVDPRD